MKCVVINLAEQTRRWEAMAAQCTKAGLDFQRFEAIRANALSPEALEAVYSPARNHRQYFQPLTAGEIGCYASHAAIWRALVASTDSHWLVCEDDVHFQPNLSAVLQAITRLSDEWELIKLIGRQHEKIIAARPWFGGQRLIRYRRIPSLCGAYVISRRGAERMLASHVPFGRPVDLDMRYWWESGCRIVGTQPYPVALSPLSEQSTIGDRRTNLGLTVLLRRALLRTEYNFRNWRANQSTSAISLPDLPEDDSAPALVTGATGAAVRPAGETPALTGQP